MSVAIAQRIVEIWEGLGDWLVEWVQRGTTGDSFTKVGTVLADFELLLKGIRLQVNPFGITLLIPALYHFNMHQVYLMWPGWLGWFGRSLVKRLVDEAGELAFVEAFPSSAYTIWNSWEDWTILTLNHLLSIGQMVCLIGE